MPMPCCISVGVLLHLVLCCVMRHDGVSCACVEAWRFAVMRCTCRVKLCRVPMVMDNISTPGAWSDRSRTALPCRAKPFEISPP